MSRIRTTYGRVALALIALAAGCVIAACGSSSASTTSTTASASKTTAAKTTASASSASKSRAQLVACLKQHGVTLPSRPSGTRTRPTPGGAPPAGGGVFFGGGGRAGGARFRGNSKFAAAFKACGANFRVARGRAGAFRISHTAINNYVACVRKHGFPQMPNPNFSGKGSVFPSSIRTNPKFEAASKPCASELRPAGGPGGSSGGSSSGSGTTASS